MDVSTTVQNMVREIMGLVSYVFDAKRIVTWVMQPWLEIFNLTFHQVKQCCVVCFVAVWCALWLCGVLCDCVSPLHRLVFVFSGGAGDCAGDVVDCHADCVSLRAETAAHLQGAVARDKEGKRAEPGCAEARHCAPVDEQGCPARGPEAPETEHAAWNGRHPFCGIKHRQPNGQAAQASQKARVRLTTRVCFCCVRVSIPCKHETAGSTTSPFRVCCSIERVTKKIVELTRGKNRQNKLIPKQPTLKQLEPEVHTHVHVCMCLCVCVCAYVCG